MVGGNATGLVPLYQGTSTKTMSQLRSAAEAAIDYTIDQIGYGLEYVNPSALDDPNPGPPYTSFVAPAGFIMPKCNCQRDREEYSTTFGFGDLIQ